MQVTIHFTAKFIHGPHGSESDAQAIAGFCEGISTYYVLLSDVTLYSSAHLDLVQIKESSAALLVHNTCNIAKALVVYFL